MENPAMPVRPLHHRCDGECFFFCLHRAGPVEFIGRASKVSCRDAQGRAPMISGTHRNSAQEQDIYGRPAAEALVALADEFGARRMFLGTTRSLDRADDVA